MKKSLLIFSALIGLSVNAHADLIDLPSYVSGADVTISNLQTTNTTIENWANGNVEGGGKNIKAGSITSQDLSTTISPVTRWDEAFNDFTYTGMLPATDSDLTSDISAGTSYVNGNRLTTNATSHTYTASKDTYVYIHSGGYFVYQEVANGASAPSTPANTLLLAKVVTNGTQITSVSDLRTTSIQITVTTTNFPTDYRSQAFVSWDSTTAMHVEPGHLAIGTSIFSRTSDTSSKSISSSTNWVEGGVPSLTSPRKVYMYAYNDAGSTFDFKFSSIDPVYSDSSSNTGGVLRYYSTGGVTYRAIGWVLASADAVQSNHFGNFKDMGVSNIVRNPLQTLRTCTTALPVDNTLPSATEGDEVFRQAIVASNPLSKLRIRAKVMAAPAANEKHAMTLLGPNNEVLEVTAMEQTAAPHELTVETIHTPGTIGYVEYKTRIGRSGGGAIYVNGEEGGTQLFAGKANSFIEIEELSQ